MKTSLITLTLTLLISLLPETSLAASKTELVLKPAKCVSLRQGQICYADVELIWNSTQIGDYCLYASIQDKPLTCWQKEASGQFSGELSADHNIRFTLKKGNVIVGEAELQMAWVYKKKRSSVSWRVF